MVNKWLIRCVSKGQGLSASQDCAGRIGEIFTVLFMGLAVMHDQGCVQGKGGFCAFAGLKEHPPRRTVDARRNWLHGDGPDAGIKAGQQ